jgi:hypothetical protein
MFSSINYVLASPRADNPSDCTCLPYSLGVGAAWVVEPVPPIAWPAGIVLVVAVPGLTDIVNLKRFGFQ